MAIVIDIDVMLAKRKMSVGELAERVGITPANLAVLKNGRAKAVRFTTLAALCDVLECQPGDLLRWEAGARTRAGDGGRRRSRLASGAHPGAIWEKICVPCAPAGTDPEGPPRDHLRHQGYLYQLAILTLVCGQCGNPLRAHAQEARHEVHAVLRAAVPVLPRST